MSDVKILSQYIVETQTEKSATQPPVLSPHPLNRVHDHLEKKMRWSKLTITDVEWVN